MATSELGIKPVRCGCGGKAKITILHWDTIEDYDDPTYLVECENCEISTKDYDTEAEAVKVWNKAMGERTAKVEYRITKMGYSYRCSNCDNFIPNSCVKFCPECGARLEWK